MSVKVLLSVFAFLTILMSIEALAIPHQNDLKIITRAEWGAAPPKRAPTKFSKVPPYLVIHHSAGPSCTQTQKCKSLIKNIQDYHMNSNGWDDIGYNFLVGEDGNVYEGRGWDNVGAHAKDFNSQSMGVCILGTYTNRVPSDAALNATKSLIDHVVKINKIKSNYGLLGHREVRETECPGDALFRLIQTWPHFESRN